MTGAAFVESVLDYFSEYDRGMGLALEERDVWIIACDIINKQAKIGLFENMQAGDPNAPEQYTMNFRNITIYRDNELALCYSNLPAQPISLPSERGIDFVSGMRSRNNPFVICHRNQVPMVASGGKKYYEEGATYCWKEGKRLYYDVDFDETNMPKIFMRIVGAGASAIDMQSELPLDATQVQAVRLETIDYFMANEKRRQDFTKDSRQDN
jgi:hypothetical protein